MWLAVLSIIIITGSVWLLNKILPFKLCPVCAGVSGTWILITLGIIVEVLTPNPWNLITSILMGGTVVGIAYQGEKSLQWVRRYPVAWKLSVIVVGFPLVYGAVQYMSWITFGIELVALSGVVYLFFIRRGVPGASHVPHGTDAQDVQKIEKGLEQCC